MKVQDLLLVTSGFVSFQLQFLSSVDLASSIFARFKLIRVDADLVSGTFGVKFHTRCLQVYCL